MCALLQQFLYVGMGFIYSFCQYLSSFTDTKVIYFLNIKDELKQLID